MRDPTALINASPPSGRGKHRTRIDLKLNGGIPVVNLGRICSLTGEVPVVNTCARLAAAEAGVISASGART